MPKDPSDQPDTQVAPDLKLEKGTRRIFTLEYKQRIIQEADTCKHDELGPLLRCEKHYSNQLADWRREYTEGGVAGLEKSIPGTVASKTTEWTSNRLA